MDYLALRIPADTKEKITSHIVKDQPSPEEGGGYPFKGDDAPMSCAAVAELKSYLHNTLT